MQFKVLILICKAWQLRIPAFQAEPVHPRAVISKRVVKNFLPMRCLRSGGGEGGEKRGDFVSCAAPLEKLPVSTVLNSKRSWKIIKAKLFQWTFTVERLVAKPDSNRENLANSFIAFISLPF